MIDLSNLKQGFSIPKPEFLELMSKSMQEWVNQLLPLHELALKYGVNSYYMRTVLGNGQPDPSVFQDEQYLYYKANDVNVIGISSISPYIEKWDDRIHKNPTQDWDEYFENHYRNLDIFERSFLHSYTFRLNNRESPYDEMGNILSEEFKKITGNPKAGISLGGYTVISNDIDTYYKAFDNRRIIIYDV